MSLRFHSGSLSKSWMSMPKMSKKESGERWRCRRKTRMSNKLVKLKLIFDSKNTFWIWICDLSWKMSGCNCFPQSPFLSQWLVSTNSRQKWTSKILDQPLSPTCCCVLTVLATKLTVPHVKQTSSLVLSTSWGSFTRPLLATVSISYG